MGISRDEIERRAEILGFTLKTGTRKGSGYVLVNEAGAKPLGDDYTASLSKVGDYLERSVRRRLKALGLSFKKTPAANQFDELSDGEARSLQRAFVGFSIENQDGETVLDNVSWEDVAHYAIEASDDAGIEDDDVESGLRDQKPALTDAQVRQSLRGRADAATIDSLFNDKRLTKDEVRIRQGADHAVYSVVTANQRLAYDRLSEDEKQAFMARQRAALKAYEKARAAKYGYEVSRDGADPSLVEIGRRNNATARAEQMFQAHRAADDDPDFLPPEAGTDYAPTPATGFTVTPKRSRLSREDIRRRQEEVRQKSDLDKIADSIRAALARRPTPQRNAELGELLHRARK
jgi:hypothetical protein